MYINQSKENEIIEYLKYLNFYILIKNNWSQVKKTNFFQRDILFKKMKIEGHSDDIKTNLFEIYNNDTERVEYCSDKNLMKEHNEFMFIVDKVCLSPLS